VGLYFQVPKELHEVQYFGLGPHENYIDRQAGALLDVHTAHVKDFYVPYVVPCK
jgi:beta-galactosidase